MKDIPIYDKTAAYAAEHKELEAYRASYKANMACKKSIADAIHNNYNGYRIDTETALKQLSGTFPLERIATVMAVTIREHDYDGRISRDNKEWAKSFPFPRNIDNWGVDRNTAFFIDSVHPGLLDLFADAVRKELALSKTAPSKKPSLVEKISRPLPQKDGKAVSDKGQEL